MLYELAAAVGGLLLFLICIIIEIVVRVARFSYNIHKIQCFRTVFLFGEMYNGNGLFNANYLRKCKYFY